MVRWRVQKDSAKYEKVGILVSESPNDETESMKK